MCLKGKSRFQVQDTRLRYEDTFKSRMRTPRRCRSWDKWGTHPHEEKGRQSPPTLNPLSWPMITRQTLTFFFSWERDSGNPSRNLLPQVLYPIKAPHSHFGALRPSCTYQALFFPITRASTNSSLVRDRVRARYILLSSAGEKDLLLPDGRLIHMALMLLVVWKNCSRRIF